MEPGRRVPGTWAFADRGSLQGGRKIHVSEIGLKKAEWKRAPLQSSRSGKEFFFYKFSGLHEKPRVEALITSGKINSFI